MRFKYSYDFSSTAPAALILRVFISKGGTRIECRAKIDSGADRSAIPDKIRETLNLKPRQAILTKGAFDKTAILRPMFLISIYIDNLFSFELQVLSRPSEYVLIGRDLLNQIVLHADGPSEFFELTNGATLHNSG